MNAKKRDVREVINENEFNQILDILQNNYAFHHFVSSRKKTALLLLYLTGLRVSSLLLLTVRNVKEVMERGETFVNLIQNKNHPITVGKKGLTKL